MSEVLRDIEAGAHSQTAQAKRIDAVVMALADVYGKLDALTVYLDGDASDEAATAAIARLLDRSYADGILRAAKQIDSMSPEKLDEYNQRLRKREVGNPSGDNRFWSTDRRERRVRKLIGDRKIVTDGLSPRTVHHLAKHHQTPIPTGYRSCLKSDQTPRLTI